MRPKDAPDGVIALVRAETAAALRLALLVGGIATLATFGTILLKMEVFRLVIPTGSIPTAIGLAAGFAIVAALLVGLDHLRDVALLAAANRMARRLSGPAVLAAAARVGDPAASAGALLADVEEVRRAISGPLCTAVLDAVLVPAVLVVLWILHPWFAALAGVACALALLASLGAERRARAALAEANGLAARTSGLVADAMRCAEAVEAMGMRPALARRWLADLRGGGTRMSGAQEVGRRLVASLGALTSLAAGGAMLLGAGLSLRGEDLGVGLMIAMLLTGRVIEPFARFGAASADWGAASAAWTRLRATVGRDAVDSRAAFPCPEGRLVLERLTYLHPGTPRPLLREVDLTVLPGEVVAITGGAGAGKTTLLRLMLGLHRPTAGGTYLDGHATHGWDREDLARHVGYLPQNPDLGEGTIAEVIARLSPRPDLRAVLRAARLCGADRMIAGLPLGYATPVGAGGTESRLSAGQRQRVALARAVYDAPRVVLLDEPAAWLDAEGEAAVLRLLGRLREAGTAVVLTTHLPGVLATADRILALSGGTLGPPRGRSAVVAPFAKPAA